MPSDNLTPLQRDLIVIVGRYPGQFTRSGLSKLLVGAKSWQNESYPEYRLYPGFGRKEMDYQIEILVQQSLLALDDKRRLVPTGGVGN